MRILDSKEFARVSSLVLANDSEPDDGTPGFGAVVALIALIGAAPLALGHQN